MTDYIDIVNSYDLISIVESYGVKLKGYRNKWGICPMPFHGHTNNTHSFSIYQGEDRQRFKCHGNCGARGDVIDFIGYMEIPGYNPMDNTQRSQALSYLRNGRQPTPPKYDTVKRKPFLPQFLYKKFFPLAQNVKEYLIMRGLEDDLIEQFNFGSASKIVDNKPIKQGIESILSIPTFESGTLMGVKLRALGNDGKFRYFSITGSRSSFWGFDDVYHTTEPVLVTKGELCAAVMRQAGFLSAAPTGGEGQKASFDRIKDALVLTKSIYIADNDETGYKYGPTRAALLHARLKYPPKRYKDWDEWYLDEPEKAVGETRQWIQTMLR